MKQHKANRCSNGQTVMFICAFAILCIRANPGGSGEEEVMTGDAARLGACCQNPAMLRGFYQNRCFSSSLHLVIWGSAVSSSSELRPVWWSQWLCNTKDLEEAGAVILNYEKPFGLFDPLSFKLKKHLLWIDWELICINTKYNSIPMCDFLLFGICKFRKMYS